MKLADVKRGEVYAYLPDGARRPRPVVVTEIRRTARPGMATRVQVQCRCKKLWTTADRLLGLWSERTVDA